MNDGAAWGVAAHQSRSTSALCAAIRVGGPPAAAVLHASGERALAGCGNLYHDALLAWGICRSGVVLTRRDQWALYSGVIRRPQTGYVQLLLFKCALVA